MTPVVVMVVALVRIASVDIARKWPVFARDRSKIETQLELWKKVHQAKRGARSRCIDSIPCQTGTPQEPG